MVFSGVVPEIAAGDYYLVFAQEGRVVESYSVEVMATTGALTVRSITPDPQVLVPGELSTVEAVVESTYSTSREFEMGLYLCSLTDNNSLRIEIRYDPQTMTIEPNESTTLTFSTTIPDTFAEGDYYLVLADANTLKIFDFIVVEVKAQSSVYETVSPGDKDGNCKYYNLQGVEVDSDDLTPGIYIRLSGNKTEKVLVK